MKIDGNTTVNVTLNLDMLNTVITSLGTQPYDRVAAVISTLQKQATQQVNAMQLSQESADAAKEDKSAA
jgi:hypothetical protein